MKNINLVSLPLHARCISRLASVREDALDSTHIRGSQMNSRSPRHSSISTGFNQCKSSPSGLKNKGGGGRINSGRNDASAKYSIGSSSLQLFCPRKISFSVKNLSFSLRLIFADPEYDKLLLETGCTCDVKSGNMAGIPDRVQWENLKVVSKFA